MATLAVKFVTIVLLIAVAADLTRCVRVLESGKRNSIAFNQLKGSRVWEGRQKRDVSSLADSVQCIRIGGIVEERTKEDKFRSSFTNEVHLNGDNKANLQLAWTGQNYERIIVVTGDFGVSSVYISEQSGRQFKNITEVVEKTDGFSELTLLKHSNDSKIVYLVSNNLVEMSTLYVSLDGADTFTKVKLDFKLEGSVVFHASKVDSILAIDEYRKMLYLSKDKGLSWKHIKSNVVAAKWGTGPWVDEIFVITNNNSDSIFFEITSMTGSVLEKSSDWGETWKLLHENVYVFGMGDKFLYASIYKTQSPGSDRFLIVSTDAGLSWNEVRLPVITPERFFSILDSTEGQIFLHVDHPGDTGRGTLYTSDSTGIVFSESLANHLYPNYEDLTDFYKVQSMRGVYIASQLMEDDSIHTMITFDRGGEWQPIRRPEGVPCKDETKECYLQIHNLYSMKRGILAEPPMSVPNAAGIILVHGHVADALQTTQPDVFVTSDGGYSWRLALKGPHHCQIADHGGLLVAVPADTETPSIVKFSTDEGRCWISYNFTEKQIVFTGLLIEPGNRDMTVAIWGYTREDRIWHTHVLNFSTIIDKQCDSNDYEEWVPHQHNDNNGCLLGSKETFRRLKADSWCYNGKSYEVSKTSEVCLCTADDFDCDYGYKRINDICVKDTSANFKEIDICFRGHEEKLVPMGYHKIPGDTCSKGFLPAEAQMVNLNTLCSSDSLSVDLRPSGSSSNDPSTRSDSRRAATVLTAMFAIFSIILIIILITFFARKYKAIHKRPTYRYSSIRCEEDEPTVIIPNPNHNGTSLFEDTSDDEVPESLKMFANGKRPNGQPVGNGHIPNGSVAVETKASVHGNMKTKLIESDDELLD